VVGACRSFCGVPLPNITNVYYGCDVGYALSASCSMKRLSATKVRALSAAA
jgi:hypothetical protein